jgi:hypothetical protein
MGVAIRHARDQGGGGRGQKVLGRGVQHLGDARDLRAGRGHGLGADHQQVDVAQLAGGGDGGTGGLVDRAAVVVGEDEDGHL